MRIGQQFRCARPDGRKRNNGCACEKQKRYRVKLIDNMTDCNIAEQQSRQKYIEYQPIQLSERLHVENADRAVRGPVK